MYTILKYRFRKENVKLLSRDVTSVKNDSEKTDFFGRSVIQLSIADNHNGMY